MSKCLYLQKSSFYSSAAVLKKVSLNMKGRSSADQRWLVRQINDPFVKAAHSHNFRCRSAFKLMEMDDKFRILRPGLSVIDCGAAPGAWSQVAVQRVNSTAERPELPRGSVIGLDLLHIAPLEGAHFLLKKDITDANTHTELQRLLPQNHADVILSDMAPNASGFRELDQERLVSMCFSLLELAEKVLRPGGTLLCKYWDGASAHKLRERVAHIVSRREDRETQSQ